ncbi:MAG: acetyltransferase [Deltaproteobacteria bacterium]|nr:acetyltransferase [Deltaproteobacteria bacterium]MBW1826841.1 acetyltransferase [Deltaproteobacteria bacterium]MBW1970230.1 acetyltransferase [Deltaproteobacteria bacterium]MBW2326894.1 acetyltransferase [Deltaproteobacteria bacterium]
MKAGKKIPWIMLILLCITLIVVIQGVRHFFREDERQARVQIREAVKHKYPEAVTRLKAMYGLKPFVKPKPSVKRDAQASEIILVHGLDEPGKVWMNLAPALVMEGFSVWIMTYPNDQPITASAQFFLEHLESHHPSGTGNISIVAHSMGGLVAREMLTDPAMAYFEKVDTGTLPAVERLIMVGTPNHGSALAQFRIFTEFRDQLTNLFNQNYHWLQGILDGAGEAGIDLIPGSKFLLKLNRRSHPRNLNMLVIAGVMSPWQRNEIEEFTRKIAVELPEGSRPAVKKMEEVLLSVSNEVGDGLVSVDSAQLPGVPLRLVQGTHLSMIRNIRQGSQRVPPAIPVILEQLNRSDK